MRYINPRFTYLLTLLSYSMIYNAACSFYVKLSVSVIFHLPGYFISFGPAFSTHVIYFDRLPTDVDGRPLASPALCGDAESTLIC